MGAHISHDNIAARRAGSDVALGLLAQPLFLLSKLRREFLAEVLGLEDRSDFDFGAAVKWRLLQPRHRVVDVLDLPQPVAGDELLRFGEGSVDHGPLRARKPYALCFRAWMKPFPRLHDARLHEFFVVLGHIPQELFSRHLTSFRFLACLHYNHHSHMCLHVVSLYGGRAATAKIDIVSGRASDMRSALQSSP